MSSEEDNVANIRLRTAKDNQDILAKAALTEGAAYAPEWVRPYLIKAAPLFAILAKAVDVGVPLIAAAITQGKLYYAKLQPYHPDDILMMAFGVLLMLFGGYFPATIACIEAFRMTGWDAVSRGLSTFYEDYQAISKANEADNKEDADGDGIADVEQISAKSLVSRKLLLVLKQARPQELSAALTGIYSGNLAMLAVLKVQFAKTITLGAQIGNTLMGPAVKIFHPLAAAVVPPDYHRWIDVVIGYICKSIGIYLAWMMQRVLSAFHSAVRGARIFTDAFAVWTEKLGYHALSRGYWDEAAAFVCAGFGLYLQITTFFSLPFLLKLPLLPAILIEYLLMWALSFS